MTRRVTLLSIPALIFLAGCGSKPVPVSGVVTLDGKPVSGASVNYISEDGKTNYYGTTDDSGNFSLANGDVTGATAGSYKVVITKYPKASTGTDPNSKEAMESMKKEMDAGKKGSGAPMPKGGMPGMPMPPGGSAAGGAKSELPEIYATPDKTPLTAKVPSDGPVKFELKSKP